MTEESVLTEERVGETGARPEPADQRGPPRAEAAEIKAWRAAKVRRLPRRAWTLTLRLVVFCACALLALAVLGQVIPLTTTATQGVGHSNTPHQK